MENIWGGGGEEERGWGAIEVRGRKATNTQS